MPPMTRKRATRPLALGNDRRVPEMQVGLAVVPVPAPISKRLFTLALERPKSDEAALFIRREFLRWDSARA